MGSYKLNGKTYKTKTFKSDKEANAFMKKNKEWGVIGVEGSMDYDKKLKRSYTVFGKENTPYTVHVAKKTDLGECKMSNYEDVVKNIIGKTNSKKDQNPKIYRLTWASGQNNVVSMNEAIETINRWANQKDWQWIRVVNTETKKQQIVYESSNHIGKRLNELSV